MSKQRIVVLKFGGSVLRDEIALRGAVHEIHRWRREDYRVVAVVSALAGVTDELLQQSSETNEEAGAHAVAALVAGGELHCAAVLGLQLDRAGIPSRVLSPGTVDLIATGPALDAAPQQVDLTAIFSALDKDDVVVLPGFVAQDEHGRTVVLGRGGSDLTALFLASRLGASRCRLIKDVDGLYESDPALTGNSPNRYRFLSWEGALLTNGEIIQHKAIRFARDHKLKFELGSLNGTRPTLVGPEPTQCELPSAPVRPLRVSILGLGTVGRGVFELLQGLPNLFEVGAIFVRDLHKARGLGTGRNLLTTNVSVALEKADIVVEALTGINPADALISCAIKNGARVVTANKAVIAADRSAFLAESVRGTPSVLRSATVGGCIPLLERLTRNPQNVESVRGVLNGTANFILDGLSQGREFNEVLAEARSLGFAEADATRDLSGQDAADKLAVTAGVLSWDLDSAAVEVEQLDRDAEARAVRAAKAGRSLRQVSTLCLEAGVVRARVRLEELEAHDPLAGTKSEQNAAIIVRGSEPPEIVRGKGAGRWPTAESVMGDILQIVRERNASAALESESGNSVEAQLT